MKIRYLPIAVLATMLLAADCLAVDTIRTSEGTLQGQITALGPTEVTLKKNGVEQSVSVNTIRSIRFQDEPAMLNTARTGIAAGRYEDAIAALDRIEKDDIRSAAINQEIQYYRALAAARLALTGAGGVKEAGSALAAFVQANPKSYHYYEACEVVGDLLVAAGSPGKAKQYYDRLAQVPWPDYQMRAGVASAKAQLTSGDVEDALMAFQAVIDRPDAGALADHQRRLASLGKARCLTALGKTGEASRLAEEVIAKADPDDAALMSKAYNTLGEAYRKGGRPRDALLAYLHVDLLFDVVPAEHIVALEGLVDLWNLVEKPERADDAAEVLRKRYGRMPE